MWQWVATVSEVPGVAGLVFGGRAHLTDAPLTGAYVRVACGAMAMTFLAPATLPRCPRCLTAHR